MPLDTAKPLVVALLATSATTSSTLFGVHDILSGTCRDWELIVNGRAAASPIQPVVVARTRQPVPAANGVLVHPQAGFADLPEPDVVCITDMFLAPGQDIAGLFEPEVRWIRQRHEAGATIAAVCTGAVLLAQAGLLEGQEATSHWAFCELLGRQYPGTRWLPEKALVTAGVGQRLVMAGSGTSWHTLALYLIARFVGAEEAIQVARLNIIDWSATSPLAYAAVSRTAQIDDPLIARCQEWVALNYQTEGAVGAMVRLSGLAERTFQRRFAPFFITWSVPLHRRWRRPPPPNSPACSATCCRNSRQATGIDVRVVALGTGQALDSGRRGDADVVFVHDQAAEEKFVAEGFRRQRLPRSCTTTSSSSARRTTRPAPRARTSTAALKKLADGKAAFISRGDKSGTHAAELRYWKWPASTSPPASRPATRNAAAAWARR
jgi:transcriptional regulator GlxA family with amidase domain